MIIGHNPGLHELAVALAVDRDGRTDKTLAAAFPTAAAAVFEMNSHGKLKLDRFVAPTRGEPT
jgi:phosphohistidine phosphatase SixA